MTVKNWTNWPIDIHEEPEQIQRRYKKGLFFSVIGIFTFILLALAACSQA